MMLDENAALRVLADLGEIPTAPLHEHAVAAYVIHFLRNLGLTVQTDPYGNLLTTYRSGPASQPVALVAHLDHPALEVTAVGPGSSAQAILLGGIPVDCFARPVPVRVIHGADSIPATIVGYDVDQQTGRVSSLTLEHQGPIEVGDFAVFDLPGFQREGDELAMRAADDLAGVAAALVTLQETVASQAAGVVHGVFTRAEEIGLVGAMLVAEQRLLPTNTIVISLECSRELPGAQPGQGPVIRVGDRARSFHPDGEALLLAARERRPTLPVQRQLMSGGTCEATAFGVFGYRTTGVALPLINYHNVGPASRIAPERIHLHDFLGEIALLSTAVAIAHENPVPAIRDQLQQRVAQYRDRLRSTARAFGSP